ncbi:hypothetical protein CK203_044707 [Vitis vinifera]|uniref:Uncharacterized protein n=1 Tax=Vitis vinifera TaxID=29760 RepID=A0A438H9F8_VITVI|nr:hypothetical protein CK203_044707 [Vitis vinifera]
MLIQVNLSNDLDTASCNIELPPEGSISKSAAVKVEYLSCLKHLSSLISDSSNRMQQSTTTTLQELNEEIKRVKIELSQSRKSKNQSSS